MSERVILHCDCNSFFASVETALNPEYKNVPMAVCGSQDDRHGIVLAKNELAKKYGICTAETVFSAKKKCPSLVVAEPHYKYYAEYSKRANDIYKRYTDLVEPFGIDESWLDVTASQKLFGTGYEIAEKISSDIKKELGITISVGVSFNKVFAKLGSDYKKPDAITVIKRSDVEKIVFPLSVSALLFVGNKTADTLKALGVRTIGELAKISKSLLIMKLGKAGEMLYRYANGLDDTPVNPQREDAKSISQGFTFKHNLIGRDEWKIGIDYLAEDIGTKLREQGALCSTVQIAIKDEFLNVKQRQKQQYPPTDISAEIASSALELMGKEWNDGKPVRMITVTACNLVKKEDAALQISLFDETENPQRLKKQKTEKTVDKIRQKYGNNAIVKGAVIDTDLGIYHAPMSNKNKKKLNSDQQ